MKFVCDKCQTRYSIGEDRVRGKILKIRCKNCGNVITVREGMDSGAAGEGGERRRTTTGAPPISVATAKPAVPPPPPELHEEWYVSIDGVQTGPLSRADAQKWVASKPFEAELHCWSEGFGDWMSVDKVGHFRNLRKPSAPSRPKTVPPPIPKQEPPPKPLFASTMAALEKDASSTAPGLAVAAPPAAARTSAPGLPRVNGSAAPLPQPTHGSGPMAARGGSGQVPSIPSARGGSGQVPSIPSGGSGPVPSIPGARGGSGQVPSIPSGGSGPVPSIPSARGGSGQVPSIPSAGSGQRPSMPAAARGGADQVPSIPGARGGSGPAPAIPSGTPSGSGPIAAITAAAPSRVRTPSGRFQALKASTGAALADAFEPDDALDMPALPGFDMAPAAAPAPKPNDPFAAFDAAKPSVKQALESDDDDLSIGEVSRVVKLADIAPKPKPAALNQTGAVGRGALNATGAVGRVNQTASQPRLSPAELGMNVDPSLHGPAPDESIVARSFAQRHRRGMFALIAVAGLLVAGVIGVLVYMQSGQTDEPIAGIGGGARTIDTSRPEDIVRRQLPPTPDNPGGSGGTVATQQKPRTVPRPTGTQNTPPPLEEDPKGLSLKASEIEDMAAKQGEGTKRCYMRAQKGALGFEIAELKKIEVTLTVGKDGVVSSVGLSSHAQDTFGQCLIARIKAWKFRESPSGGTYRISLAFGS